MTNVAFEVGMKGRYKLEVIRPDGTVRTTTPWFDNLILDAGLNRIGVGGMGAYCHVGSGSIAPLVTDTGLQSFIASTGLINTQSGGTQTTAPYYSWHRRTYRFATGVAAGNISEVGISWSDTPGSLFSRALVRDTGGNPLTITVLPDEVLDVIYELRVYVPTDDTSFTMSVSGTTHSCIGRAAGVITGGYWGTVAFLFTHGTNYSGGVPSGITTRNGSLADVTELPSGSSGNVGHIANDPYLNNSLTRTGTGTFNLNDSNLSGGISALVFGTFGLGSFQFSISPPIAKTSSKVMTIRCSMSWARKTI